MTRYTCSKSLTKRGTAPYKVYILIKGVSERQRPPGHKPRGRFLLAIWFGYGEELMSEMVDGAGDDRTANNAVRHKYRVLSDAEKQQMVELKDLGAQLIAKCQEIGTSREMSIAITNAEQSVMWAVKHVTS